MSYLDVPWKISDLGTRRPWSIVTDEPDPAIMVWDLATRTVAEHIVAVHNEHLGSQRRTDDELQEARALQRRTDNELLEARALLRRWLGQTDGSGQAAREMELQEYIERVRGLREASEALLGEAP